MGIDPHWVLFQYIFCAKPQMVEKDVLQIYGRLGIQAKKKMNYFDMKWPDTVKGFQSTWFYCIEPCTTAGSGGLPPYSAGAVDWHEGWLMKLSKAQETEVKILMKWIGVLSSQGLSSNAISATGVSLQIQPLQA